MQCDIPFNFLKSPNSYEMQVEFFTLSDYQERWNFKLNLNNFARDGVNRTTFFKMWLRSRARLRLGWQVEDIYNKVWLSVSNDFWARVGRFASDHWSDQKSLSLYFLHAVLCFEHISPIKIMIDWSFAIVAKDGFFWYSILASSQSTCDATQTPGTGIVTSHSSIVLSRANWSKDYMSSLVTNIDFLPSGIDGLACKKICDLIGTRGLLIHYNVKIWTLSVLLVLCEGIHR